MLDDKVIATHHFTYDCGLGLGELNLRDDMVEVFFFSGDTCESIGHFDIEYQPHEDSGVDEPCIYWRDHYIFFDEFINRS